MKLTDLLPSRPLRLTEAKARIEHPEDLIFDEGFEGAVRAYQILKSTAAEPKRVSIKFDGRPALVFGWMGNEFVLTDKAGFSAKTYDGMTTNPTALVKMIMDRTVKDTSNVAIQQRLRYAQTIAGLYDVLRESTPKTFQGYAQGDLLYVGRPPIIDKVFEFTPNKITYRVPVASPLGEMIKHSQAGIVIHSVYSTQDDEEPLPIRDAAREGFRVDAGLAILPHEATLLTNLSLDTHLEKLLQHQFRSHALSVRKFFDESALLEAGVKTLPGLMKSYLAKRAENGEKSSAHVARDFLEWLTSPLSKTTPRMRGKCVDWIQTHLYGYNSTWRISNLLAGMKMNLKQQMDQQTSGLISARLKTHPGHEGFVSVTPHGMAKFVNRTEFMRKLEKSKLDESTAKKVAFSFGRMNPMTLGHQHLVDKTHEAAGGGDYWVFLSHSQDSKKNPLDWETKLEFFKNIMPKHRAHVYSEPNIKTVLQAADWLYSQGYRDITFVAGEDRVTSMKNMLDQWNSAPIREKSNRDEVKMSVVSAGDRDPDSDGIAGVSASKARQAAVDDDFEKFQEAVGLSEELAKSLFKSVRSGLKVKSTVKESTEHPNGTIVTLKMNPESAAMLENWCQNNGVPCVPRDSLHLTVLYSRNPVPHLCSMHGNQVKVPASVKGWTKLGDKALCLELLCPLASRFHETLRAQGGTHDWPEFLPHSSVSYEWHERSDLPAVLPDFPLLFDTIHVSDIDPDYKPKSS